MDIVEKKGYRILRPLASGGEGQVSICKKNGVHYILKVMPCIDSRQREILAQIDALPGGFFPRVCETFCDEEHSYLIREYIEGSTLREVLQKNGSLSYPHALRIFNKLCDALNLLHHASPRPIVLRDLKPENIILTPDGGVYLIDFGIARHYNPQARRDTIPAGTRGYTAPEAMTGFQSDPRSDVYSLGIVLYEMLSGKSLLDPPFQLRPLSESGVFTPKSLDRIIVKATDPRPICRYTSVSAFQAALKRIYPKNHVRRVIASCAACLLLGALLTLAFTEPSFTGFFRRSFSAVGIQEDSGTFVGLSIEQAEKQLSEQKVSAVFYGVLSNDAPPNKVVSQETVSGGVALEFCIGASSDIVAFPDSNLGKAVHEALGIPAETEISAADLQALTALDVSQRQIANLEGLQYVVNLSQLTADDNAVSDLTPLAYLGHLKALYLSDNEISDLSPLAHLKNLKTLYLENNQITSLKALYGIDLYDLSLGANDISDLSPLSGAVHMQRLNLYGNRIADCSPLQSMQSLSWLALNENQLADLRPLSDLPALTTLILAHNAIYDIVPIAANASLVSLNLSNNYILDVSPLAALTQLETLDLSANIRLTDLSALANLTSLQELGLAYLESCDYTQVFAIPALRSVTFGVNQAENSDGDFARVIEQLQSNGILVLFQ
jgi:predicted Ser/Thr protein kinase